MRYAVCGVRGVGKVLRVGTACESGWMSDCPKDKGGCVMRRVRMLALETDAIPCKGTEMWLTVSVLVPGHCGCYLSLAVFTRYRALVDGGGAGLESLTRAEHCFGAAQQSMQTAVRAGAVYQQPSYRTDATG